LKAAVLQERELGGAARPTEDAIAMRKTPKATHDVAVFARVPHDFAAELGVAESPAESDV
jgi:hypothetical protein